MEKLGLPSRLHGCHIHMVGIKGTGMAALAEILVARGAKITGSDVSDVFYTDEIIKKLGIVAKPFSAENITDKTQFVIHSDRKSVVRERV